MFKNTSFSNVEIMYKHQATLGDTLSLFYAHTSNDEYVITIKDKLDYKFWFCGHFHEELKLADNLGILYKQFVNIV